MRVTREQVVGYIRDELRINMAGVGDDTPLFSSGMIDSFSLVSLITFLEEAGGFRVNPMDVNLDNMDSIGRIVAYMQRIKATA
jgi:acyl carrier protein